MYFQCMIVVRSKWLCQAQLHIRFALPPSRSHIARRKCKSWLFNHRNTRERKHSLSSFQSENSGRQFFVAWISMFLGCSTSMGMTCVGSTWMVCLWVVVGTWLGSSSHPISTCYPSAQRPSIRCYGVGAQHKGLGSWGPA